MIDATENPTESQGKKGHALFPNLYVWFVFLSFMDVMLTRIAFTYGAQEANPFAAWLIDVFDGWGYGSLTALTVLKFTAVPIVLILCEFIGRRRYSTGRKLAEWMVALSAIPIVVTFTLLVTYLYFGRTVSEWLHEHGIY